MSKSNPIRVPVRIPLRIAFVAPVPSQSPTVRPARTHHEDLQNDIQPVVSYRVDIVISVAVGSENDPLAFSLPVGVPIVGRAVRQRFQFRAVRVHHVDGVRSCAARFESDARAVRRPRPIAAYGVPTVAGMPRFVRCPDEWCGETDWTFHG